MAYVRYITVCTYVFFACLKIYKYLHKGFYDEWVYITIQRANLRLSEIKANVFLVDLLSLIWQLCLSCRRLYLWAPAY
jgi:hypothetical protein